MNFVHEIILLEERSGFSVEVMMKGGVFPKVEIGYSMASFTLMAGLIGAFSAIVQIEPSFLLVYLLCVVIFHLLAFGAAYAFERHITPENSSYPGFFDLKGINPEIDMIRETIVQLFGIWGKNELETFDGLPGMKKMIAGIILSLDKMFRKRSSIL